MLQQYLLLLLLLLLVMLVLVLLKLLLLIHGRIAVGNILQIKMRQILQTTHYTYAPA